MRPLLLVAVLVPLVSFAAPADPAAAASRSERAGKDAKLSPEQRYERAREKVVRKTRLRRTLQVAEALELSDQDALRLSETLAKFDAQREALMEQMMNAGMTLRRAARGDTAAYGQIDQATQQFVDAKTGLLHLDRQALDVVARELKLGPDQKARLALSFGGAHGEGFRLKKGRLHRR